MVMFSPVTMNDNNGQCTTNGERVVEPMIALLEPCSFPLTRPCLTSRFQ